MALLKSSASPIPIGGPIGRQVVVVVVVVVVGVVVVVVVVVVGSPVVVVVVVVPGDVDLELVSESSSPPHAARISKNIPIKMGIVNFRSVFIGLLSSA